MAKENSGTDRTERSTATSTWYNFIVLHRPGARHGNADAMSRRPYLIDPRVLSAIL